MIGQLFPQAEAAQKVTAPSLLGCNARIETIVNVKAL
jgi:hypothetical protein